jgi:DNA-binding beta-propeller fold protein YncE
VLNFKSIISTIKSFFLVSSIGSSTSQLSQPTGLYYDEVNQNLYISNANAYTVMRWQAGASNGTILAGLAGTSGSNSIGLNTPTGITLDQWQNIYVNDRGNSRIQLFCNGNSTGITIAGSTTGGTSFSTSYDVKLDSQLNLYVADNAANRVWKFGKL